MKPEKFHLILGSRSPRRLALLQQLLPEFRIAVCPPRSADEQGFDGLTTWGEVENRLREITRQKLADVQEQCQKELEFDSSLILAADTVIVTAEGDRRIVLGQPPEPDWRKTVKMWFKDHLWGKTHQAVSAVCLATSDGRLLEKVTASEVTFCGENERLLEWYLSTEESRGKAGGYAIQGAGSVFVAELKGSLSNVIGLPLRETWEMFEELGPMMR